MSFNARHVSGILDTGLTAIGSQAAGTTLTANTLAAGALAEPGTVSAFVKVVIATGSLTLQPKWQASEDGTNWFDVGNVAGNTLMTAITASNSYFLDGPVGSFRFVRVAILTAGATAGANDKYQVNYNFDKPRYLGS